MINKFSEFKFVAMFSKKYGHIADLLINETGPATTVYGHNSETEAISYLALNEMGAISDHLRSILLSEREWDPIEHPDLIKESLELLSKTNEGIHPSEVLNDISKYLIITRMKGGKSICYYYKRNNNTIPGSNLNFINADGDPYEVGTDLSQILASLQHPANNDNDYSVGAIFFDNVYETVLKNTYAEIIEEWEKENEYELTRNSDDIPMPEPNSNMTTDFYNKAYKGLIPMNNERYEVITSRQGNGAKVIYQYEIAEMDKKEKEIEDDINYSIDRIESGKGIKFKKLAKDVYAAICAFYQYGSRDENGHVKVSLRDLMCLIFQKNRDSIKHMKYEKYEEVFDIIKSFNRIWITAFVDEELKQFHVIDPEKYGVTETSTGGRIKQDMFASVGLDTPPNNDKTKTILTVKDTPFLYSHDSMIRQVQTKPPEMLKLRGLFKPDKTVLISEIESRIVSQQNLLHRFERDNAGEELTKNDLKKSIYSGVTTINIYPLIVDAGYAIKHPTKRGDIYFPGITDQRNKKKRSIADITNYFEEQLRSGFIKSFDVVREDGSYETFWFEEEKGDIVSEKSKKFNLRSKIIKIKFYCVE